MPPHFPPVAALLLALAAFAGCSGNPDTPDSAGLRAAFSVTPAGATSLEFVFDASASEGPIAAYHWNFGDGTLARDAQARVEHTYARTNALFFATLTVESAAGDIDQNLLPVSLGTGFNYDPDAVVGNVSQWVKPGETVRFDASGSHDHDLDPLEYEWFLGAYSSTKPAEASYTTGLLSRGEIRNATFATPGVYLIHCHPHPWMRARIVVSETETPASNATLQIADYSFQPPRLVVAPGTKLQVRNDDTSQHTATTEFFLPGSSVTTGSLMERTLEAVGDYQAWLIVGDGKNGRTLISRGLRASEDAPSVAFTPVEGTPLSQADEPRTHDLPELSFNASATVTLDYQPVATSQATLVVTHKETQRTYPGTCQGNTCTMESLVPSGTYSATVRTESGVLAGYTLSATFVLYSNPGFGDGYFSGAQHVHPAA